MKREPPLDPRALIAVWADAPDALSPEERDAVEALLERDPDARAEAEALRRVVVDARALPQPPMPASAMASIADAIAQERARAARSPWTRLRAWIARPALSLGLAAAAATAVGVWVTTRPHAIETVAPIAATPDAAVPIAPLVIEPVTAGELADLGALDDRALDRLDHALGGDDEDDAGDDGLIADPDLAWVDALSPDQVDSLDRYLE